MLSLELKQEDYQVVKASMEQGLTYRISHEGTLLEVYLSLIQGLNSLMLIYPKPKQGLWRTSLERDVYRVYLKIPMAMCIHEMLRWFLKRGLKKLLQRKDSSLRRSYMRLTTALENEDFHNILEAQKQELGNCLTNIMPCIQVLNDGTFRSKIYLTGVEYLRPPWDVAECSLDVGGRIYLEKRTLMYPNRRLGICSTSE